MKEQNLPKFGKFIYIPYSTFDFSKTFFVSNDNEQLNPILHHHITELFAPAFSKTKKVFNDMENF